MSSCDFPKTWLALHLDDELDERARKARDHIKECRECAAEVESWRANGEALRLLVDQGVGEVEPLLALEKIHARIAAAHEMPFFDRLRRSWAELLLLHRRALAGVAVAAVLGMLTAPALVYWLGQAAVGPTGVESAVVVESLEIGGSATAVVWSADGSDTTIIWVESDANADTTDESL